MYADLNNGTKWLLTFTINGPNDIRNTDSPATANVTNRCRENEVSTGVPSGNSRQHRKAVSTGILSQKADNIRMHSAVIIIIIIVVIIKEHLQCAYY